jgi:glucose/arabinose dehydrogenase
VNGSANDDGKPNPAVEVVRNAMLTKYAPALRKTLLLALLGGCGGGGGSDSSSQSAAGVSQTNAPNAANITLALQTVAGGLSSPIFLTAPSGDARLFIVEREGRIRIVQNGSLLPEAFLDISGRTTTDGERGLLSMAFDPQYASNGFFYVFYTDVDGVLAIERFSVAAADSNLAEPLSGLRIISIPHVDFSYHNGGLLAFGPDGFLYIGTGDGAGTGDPGRNGQNTNSLLGKLLRIDVSASTADQPYAIPASNPFVNQSGMRGEIWASGLRNPWRYAFDAATNLLYIADVGASRREEVNVAGTGIAGLNYGWSVMEATLCFADDSCDQQGLTLPVLDYGHDTNGDGACSIIGGYVYRGSAIPDLQGSFLYADLCAGWLKGLTYVDGAVTRHMDWGNQNIGAILSFGEDARKELYLLASNGNVYRIVRR